MASIEKRGSKFRAVVSYVDFKGTRQKENKTFERKKDAVKWASEIELKIKSGMDLSQGKLVFPDYYKNWVKTYKLNNMRPASQKKYITWQNNISEMFAGVPLNKLTTPYLQQVLDEFGETHSHEYTKNITLSIKSSLKDAQIEGIIDKDIYSRLKAHGTGGHSMRNKNYLDESEYLKLRDYLYDQEDKMVDDPYYLVALIALETGARGGEVQALELSGFDFKHKTMTINKSYSNGVKAVTAPKNKSSVRTIALPDSLTQTIKQYFKKSNHTSLLDDYYNQVTLGNRLSRITKELSITPIRFHGLRHSHVSYLLHNDVDVTYVSKRVGHANTTVTLKTYAHMLKEKELTQEELALTVLEKGLK